MSSPKDPKRYYRIEAREIVDGMSAELLALSKGETRPEATSRLFRQAHTLKGAATVVGDTAVVETARILEDVLGAHREAKTHLSLQEVTEFLHIAEALDGMLTSEAPALPAGIAAQPDEPGSPVPGPVPDADQLGGLPVASAPKRLGTQICDRPPDPLSHG